MVRPYRRVDFAPILVDDYVNYAQEGFADLLTSYNLYQHYPHGLETDQFGHSLWLEGWRVNPYLDDAGCSPFFLLKVTVRNGRREKIAIAPLEAVILDGQGHQHRALGAEDLLAISETSAHPLAVGLQKGPLPSWGWVRQLYLKGDILRRTLLLDQHVFPQVTCSGIVAFRKFDSALDGLQLVLPEVVLFRDGEPFRTLDFQFLLSGEDVP